MIVRLDRRRFLGAAAMLAASPVVFAHAATKQRFVFIIQRGAADGLNTVVPYADPAYARLRGGLAIEADTALKLDGTFALHPSLAGLHRRYLDGEAIFFHAIASPYRDRSHSDGQNVLETGGRSPYQLKDGWLNRLLGLLPGTDRAAIALSPSIPLALRGAIDVASYAPSSLPQADQDLLIRVEQLYATDPQLHALWSSAMAARSMAGEAEGTERRQDAARLGRLTAGFLAKPDGPRIAMIETNGWDTHSAQNARLAARLSALDNLVAGLHQGLASVWNQTVILIATEFGRTAAANGTGGTDHGTGAAAMLTGGGVRGSRVIADWPGLAASELLDGRDLKPTLGLDRLIASICAETFQLPDDWTSGVLFPAMTAGSRLPQMIRVV
jgi:uncharacterized protein (DUF1501 family)